MYLEVLAQHPRHATAVHLLGLLAFQAGRLDVAEHMVGEAIKIDGYHAPYRADLGEVLRAQGKRAEAVTAFEKAIKLNDKVADFHAGLGSVLTGVGRPRDAVNSLERALALDAAHVEAPIHLAHALVALGQADKALPLFEAAIRAGSADASIYLGYGRALYAVGRGIEAIACFRKSIQLQPRLAEAHVACGTSRLAQGDYAAAWSDYGWRVRCRGFARSVNLPAWDGSSDERVHLLCDKSASETLLLLRYAKLLAERDVNFVLDVPAALVPLVAAELRKHLLEADSAQAANVQCQLAQLPGLFRTTPQSIPSEIPYLEVDRARADAWRARLESHKGLRVGLARLSEPTDPLAGARELPIHIADALGDLPNVQLFALEPAAWSESASPPIDPYAPAKGELSTGAEPGLAEAAALMGALDLVIAADGPMAHLAGALGANVWVALSRGADWCWMQNIDRSSWYPAARLFRPTAEGGWDELIARIRSEVAQLAASPR